VEPQHVACQVPPVPSCLLIFSIRLANPFSGFWHYTLSEPFWKCACQGENMWSGFDGIVRRRAAANDLRVIQYWAVPGCINVALCCVANFIQSSLPRKFTTERTTEDRSEFPSLQCGFWPCHGPPVVNLQERNLVFYCRRKGPKDLINFDPHQFLRFELKHMLWHISDAFFVSILYLSRVQTDRPHPRTVT
jgi:hypothetical protein